MNRHSSWDRFPQLRSALVAVRASPDNDGGLGVPGVSVVLPAQPLIEAIMPVLNFCWPLAFYVGEDSDDLPVR